MFEVICIVSGMWITIQ